MTRQNQIRTDICYSIDLALEFYERSKDKWDQDSADFWLGVADRYTKELLEMKPKGA